MKTLVVGFAIILFFLVLPFLIIFFVIFILRTNARMMTEKYQKLAMGLGGEVISQKNTCFARAVSDGVEIRAWTFRERRDLSSKIQRERSLNHYLILEAVSAFGFHMLVCQDNFLFQLAEKLGGIVEVQVGDPEFDQKYMIRGSEPGRVMAFFESRNRREAVNKLFSKGFRELRVWPEALQLKKLYRPEIDLNPSNLQEYKALLVQLVKG